jgi:sugar-specific transcriptional regulator TrmB
MYENTLSKAGLSPDQARIYEVLLKSGALPAGEVSKKAELKRGLTYKVLDELVLLGLAKKNDKGKVLRFEPTHPLQLKELAERKEQEAKVAQEALGGIIGNLVSDFNLISGKPGIQVFEGLAGVKQVLLDSLTAKEEILSYADLESIAKYIPKVNEWYVNERERRGIVKRGIVLDTPFNRNFLRDYHQSVTDARLIGAGIPPFAAIMQMYDSKISYITLESDRVISVLISDKHLYAMHAYLFNLLWQSATPYLQPESK